MADGVQGRQHERKEEEGKAAEEEEPGAKGDAYKLSIKDIALDQSSFLLSLDYAT